LFGAKMPFIRAGTLARSEQSIRTIGSSGVETNGVAPGIVAGGGRC
jgi:hypothetical protein